MLDIRKLKKEYNGRFILKDVNLHVKSHEIVAVVGPSGCGKSTLLNLIAGIAGEYEGTIENHAAGTGYVFQEDRILPWLTLYDNIRIVREREDRDRIQSLIAQMRLEGFEHYYPAMLSGGMRQRCGIARAFYYGSQLLLMDEPFKSLDFHLRLELLEHLAKLWEREQASVVFVTHDIDEALMLADRIVVLKGRPASVIKEVTLPKGKRLRDMAGVDMIKIKAELLRLTA